MNKRHLHHLWTKIRQVNYWYFLVGFMATAALFIYAYRQNNVQMIKLRDAVFVADQNNQDLEGSLRRLRSHIYNHMNTQLASGPTAIRPPIQLKYEYERLVKREKSRVAKANTSLRHKAEAICKRRFPNTANATGVQPCIQGIMNERGARVQQIPKELYQFDFASPVWTPDLAGLSLVLCSLFGILFATRLITELWLRQQLRNHA